MSNFQASFGPWLVEQGANEYSILDRDGNVIALVDEPGNAAVMASAKEMLDALIEIHEIAQEITDAEVKERIEDTLSLAFQKLAAESDA